MRKFLLFVSLGVTLASGADAELSHEEALKVRQLYDNLKLSDMNFEYMSTKNQIDFIYSGLQDQDFSPSRQDIQDVLIAIKNEINEPDKNYIKHLHEMISASDAAYNFLDTDNQSKVIIEAFEKLKPESRLTEKEVRKIFYSIKGEAPLEKKKKETIKHVYESLYSSDPSFKFLDEKAKYKDVYKFCKKLYPDLEITKKDVRSIVSTIKNEDASSKGQIDSSKTSHKTPSLSSSQKLSNESHFASHSSNSLVSPRKAG